MICEKARKHWPLEKPIKLNTKKKRKTAKLIKKDVDMEGVLYPLDIK